MGCSQAVAARRPRSGDGEKASHAAKEPAVTSAGADKEATTPARDEGITREPSEGSNRSSERSTRAPATARELLGLSSSDPVPLAQRPTAAAAAAAPAATGSSAAAGSAASALSSRPAADSGMAASAAKAERRPAEAAEDEPPLLEPLAPPAGGHAKFGQLGSFLAMRNEDADLVSESSEPGLRYPMAGSSATLPRLAPQRSEDDGLLTNVEDTHIDLGSLDKELMFESLGRM
eukprot:TRINITY_DN10249_c0_g2_i1.p1 TRINITY_DN10249_c0_g2~~TRINITY_DN10249_c0_g2_i1.p1  ORF type:complete len:248 (-),score=66.86 TRINITY_DN10249_c0_g2_i1:125-823(-)